MEEILENKEFIDIPIDTGLKNYRLVDSKSGETIGMFPIRPSDLDIAKRYDEVVEYFNKLQVDEKDKDALENLGKEFKEKFDYLLKSDSSCLFDLLNPFSPLSNGKMYIESALETISAVIEKEIDVRTKKLTVRMNKYTKKYHK